MPRASLASCRGADWSSGPVPALGLELRSRSSCGAAGAREVALRGRGAAASRVLPGKRLQPVALCKTFVFKMRVMGEGERWKDVD